MAEVLTAELDLRRGDTHQHGHVKAGRPRTLTDTEAAHLARYPGLRCAFGRSIQRQ